MVRLFPWLWLLVFVCACGSQGPSPADIAGHAAKVYYDRLLQGHYDQFVDGRYLPDSIPASYRGQLVTNMQMFMSCASMPRVASIMRIQTSLFSMARMLRMTL